MGLSQAPARPATKKQRKPEPARVVETYYYEVKARGQWGAFTRTAAIYRLSDETIRRYVKQATAPAAPPLDAELQYQPAPGEKPVAPRVAPPLPQKQRRPRPKCHTICHSRVMQQSGLLRQPVRSNVANVAQNQPPTFHSAEREPVPLDTGKLPQLAAPRSYPRRPAPRPAHADMLDWMRGNLFAPGPALALLVFLALLWLVVR